MHGSQREEARRGLDWLKRGQMFLEGDNLPYAKEAFDLAKEHLNNALMTDAELLQSVSIHAEYEQGLRAHHQA